MWNIIKEYRHYLGTLVLIVVPMIALNAGGKTPANLYWFDRAAISLSAPVQTVIKGTLELSWDTIQSYLLLLHTQRVNQDLLIENQKLMNEVASFQEIERENARLKQIVDFNQAIEGKRFVARVIAQDVSPEFRTIRLNKGSDKGITPGMAVIAIDGVVGRVIRSGPGFSDVLTLLDSSSAIDGLLQRNRVRGIVEGRGNQILSLKYLRRTDDVQENDIILSSGVGGLFPKGLAIGKVVSVKKKNYGITQEVEIMPSVDLNRLEEVTIIEPPARPKFIEEELKKKDK